MRSSKRRILRIGALLLGVAGLGACIAPILNVPPPGAMQISFALASGGVDGGQTDGGQPQLWRAQGEPLPQAALATYYVRNRAMGGHGVFATARADGSFTTLDELQGTRGDQIQIYYLTPAGDYSDSVCVLLVEGSTTSFCPP